MRKPLLFHRLPGALGTVMHKAANLTHHLVKSSGAFIARQPTCDDYVMTVGNSGAVFGYRDADFGVLDPTSLLGYNIFQLSAHETAFSHVIRIGDGVNIQIPNVTDITVEFKGFGTFHYLWNQPGLADMYSIEGTNEELANYVVANLGNDLNLCVSTSEVRRWSIEKFGTGDPYGYQSIEEATPYGGLAPDNIGAEKCIRLSCNPLNGNVVLKSVSLLKTWEAVQLIVLGEVVWLTWNDVDRWVAVDQTLCDAVEAAVDTTVVLDIFTLEEDGLVTYNGEPVEYLGQYVTYTGA